ncbi:MAG: DoxX family protein [Chloroflexi bacterium]|nr:DoxX family protein [Chloroflexota bacterium]
MTPRAFAYWATTGFVVFNMFTGALAELARLTPNVEGMQALGYPIYMMTILGTWKVLGSITLLVPRFPRLKEWAYAGMFFNMTGAAVSHLVAGDEAWHVWYTASLAIVVLVSWALRPESRTLGAPLIHAAMRPIRRTKLAGAEVPA